MEIQGCGEREKRSKGGEGGNKAAGSAITVSGRHALLEGYQADETSRSTVQRGDGAWVG